MIMKTLLYRPQVMRMLSLIYSRGEIIVNEVSQELNIIYSYTCKIIIQLEKEGIIKSHKEGRKKYIKLTNKGKELAKPIYELNKNINKNG